MKYNYGALSIGLIILLVCIVGCTSTAPSTSQITPSPSAQPVMSTQSVTQLVSQTTPVSTISLPIEKQNITPNRTTQLVTITGTQQTQVVQESKPYVNNLQFRKNYFYSSINNCPMEEIFSSITKDPNYGLNQPVPKIIAISQGEFNTIIRDFTEGKNENTKVIGIARCQGAIVTPYWNFVQITSTLTPTNPRPSNYTISLNIRSKGKIVAQVNTTELLVQDHMITLTSYIPLKSEEMEIFDGVEITFYKLS